MFFPTVLPLLLLLPVQKSDDLCPHEWNKHPVEEPWTEPPSHGKEQPQGQYKLDRAEHTSSLSSSMLRQYHSLCGSWTCPVLVAWLCPSPGEMTSTPSEGALAILANSMTLTSLMDPIYILCMFCSAQKRVGTGRGDRMLLHETEILTYFGTETQFQVYDWSSW